MNLIKIAEHVEKYQLESKRKGDPSKNFLDEEML